MLDDNVKNVKIFKSEKDLPTLMSIAGFQFEINSSTIIEIGCQKITFKQIKNLLNIMKAINQFPPLQIGDYNTADENILLKKGRVKINDEIVSLKEVETVYNEMLKLKKKKK